MKMPIQPRKKSLWHPFDLYRTLFLLVRYLHEIRALLLARYESLTETLEETDWEALQKDSNVELWAIRIPRDVCTALNPVGKVTLTLLFALA